MKSLLRLAGLALLTSCTTASPAYWQGFHGPAYLPSRPVPTPSHRFDSLTTNYPAAACQLRGKLPR
jgi:hypothetical protein